jgi:hypothetical protein
MVRSRSYTEHRVSLPQFPLFLFLRLAIAISDPSVLFPTIRIDIGQIGQRMSCKRIETLSARLDALVSARGRHRGVGGVKYLNIDYAAGSNQDR